MAISFIKLTYLSLGICLAGCCQNHPKAPSERSSKNTNITNISTHPPAMLLSAEEVNFLPQEEQQFYHDLNSKDQALFLTLSAEERARASAMTRKMTSDEAVALAADRDTDDLSLSEQTFYHKLSPLTKILYLTLNPDSTELAIKYAKASSYEQAVQKAAEEEAHLLPLEDQLVYDKLSDEMKILFLTLTPSVRNKAVLMAAELNPNTAVKKASEFDVRKLPETQQEFYGKLTPNMQILFLILTPRSRTLALLLSKQMDAHTALQYAIKTPIVEPFRE